MPKLSTALVLILGLASMLLVACEGQAVTLQHEEAALPQVEPRRSSLALQTLAAQARSDQEFSLCADAFAAAASASFGEGVSANWYQASRCAARAGDYRTSGFLLQTAAASGYADAEQLQSDPWMRPLQSSNRYQLTLDIVQENQRTQRRQEKPLTICQLVQATRSHWRASHDQEVVAF
jgi:hypothetical protein